MPRTLTGGMTTAIAATEGELIHFIELRFSGGTQYVSTGTVTMPWNAETWVALGGDLRVNVVEEKQDLSAGAVDLVLSGVDQAILLTLFTEHYINREVIVRLVHLAAGAIIADPVVIFSGYMNGGWTVSDVRKQEGGGTVTVTCKAVGRLARLDLRRGFQTNLASHQAVYAGDLFFQHVNDLKSKRIIWRR